MIEPVSYEFNGKSQPLKDWAESMGTATKTLRRRLDSGWPLERVLTTPVQTKAIKPEGYWSERIMSQELVKSGNEFTLVQLSHALKISTAALNPHFTVLRNKELFTELPSKNERGKTYMKFRLRSNCSEVLKSKDWRKTNNDWLGLEPRLGIQW